MPTEAATVAPVPGPPSQTVFPTIYSARRKSRRRHLWVYSSEIEKIDGSPVQGDVVRVIDNGFFAGNAVYAPHSLIKARIFARENRDLDTALLVERIRTALELRRSQLPGEEDFRLLYGESDMVPGLVVDRYGMNFVVQIFSAGMERRLDLVLAALRQVFPVESVHAKNDFRLRAVEGLPGYERTLLGTVPETLVIHENGAQYLINITQGQKTGFYFDQRLTRHRVRALSEGRNVLDVFCYTGGFAINAALGGAREVLALDGSEAALELVTRHAAMNQVGERMKTIRGNAFQLLRSFNEEGRRFDLIILDPPPFVKRPQEKQQGIKGYRDINYQAMKLLNPAGILVSCSCSHHMAWQDLLDVLDQASQGCGRELRIMERIGASPDHPVILGLPETEYLRCFLLEVR